MNAFAWKMSLRLHAPNPESSFFCVSAEKFLVFVTSDRNVSNLQATGQRKGVRASGSSPGAKKARRFV